MKITIKDFTLKKIHYHFLKPIILSIHQDFHSLKYTGYDNIFDIFVYVDSFEEVEKEYQRDFAELYEAYALEDDENLDRGARRLKRKFLKYCSITRIGKQKKRKHWLFFKKKNNNQK